MAQSDDETMQKLERVLTEAHRTRMEPTLGPVWARTVMRDIRELAASRQAGWIGRFGIEELVWRTAAVAATIALVLTLSIAAWTSSNENGMLVEELEVAALFAE